ncbi:MAG TPA: hypothetical protein VIZ18_01165, partial [Ktedonobacteraceae bacterium]
SHSLFETKTRTFCDLITELADAGHFVQSKVNDKDVRVLELEHRDGKIQVHYFLLDDDEIDEKEGSVKLCDIIDDLFATTFYVRYDEMEAQSRLYSPYFDENEEDDT